MREETPRSGDYSPFFSLFAPRSAYRFNLFGTTVSMGMSRGMAQSDAAGRERRRLLALNGCPAWFSPVPGGHDDAITPASLRWWSPVGDRRRRRVVVVSDRYAGVLATATRPGSTHP